MRKLGVCIGFLVCAILSGADICSHLPGYTVHGTSCFKVYTILVTWDDAEAACVADGGHLASIHSTEEQDFLANLIGLIMGPWIGLNGVPHNMAWSDGTDVDYENWHKLRSNGTKAHCTKIWRAQAYLWVDKSCEKKKGYICRIEDQTEAKFIRAPGGMATDPAVSPSSTHTVRSRVECAWRCQKNSDCKHFIMSEDQGKYLCETYTTLYRALTPAPLPTLNYWKTNV